MATVDLFVPLRVWRTSLFRGDQAVVDRFLGEVDRTLPPDWVRDHTYESTRLRPDRIRCYLFDRVEDASVRLWLERVNVVRVSGRPDPGHPPSTLGRRGADR